MLANIAITVAASIYAMTIGQAVPALIALLVLAVGVYLHSRGTTTTMTGTDVARVLIIVVGIMGPTLIIVNTSGMTWPGRLALVGAGILVIGGAAFVALRRLARR